jgi:hypothetical protein
VGYYRGDYYRGDYYRGDFWGGLAGAVKGFATGGITGAIGGAITGSRGGGPSGPPSPPSQPLAGGLFGIPSLGGLKNPPATGGTMKGYHLNKANEYIPGQHGKIGVAKGSKLVRNRHMNVANARALNRAARRAHGFLRMASKHIRYFKPHHPKGRPYIARKRRSR